MYTQMKNKNKNKSLIIVIFKDPQKKMKKQENKIKPIVLPPLIPFFWGGDRDSLHSPG